MSNRAIDLNNLAVAQLHASTSTDAMRLLRVALADMKDEFMSRTSSRRKPSYETHVSRHKTGRRDLGEASYPSSTSYSLVNTSEHFDQESIASSSTIDDECTNAMEVDDDYFSVSTPPLQITPVTSDALLRQSSSSDQCFVTMFDRAFCIDEDGEDEELTSAVIMYNMALVNHARGIDCGISGHLSSALTLYKMALEVVDNIDDLPIEAAILLLAIYNNMAHIAAHEFSIDDTTTALNRLRLILEDPYVSFSIDEDDYVLFYLNAVIYQEKLNFTLAPAA